MDRAVPAIPAREILDDAVVRWQDLKARRIAAAVPCNCGCRCSSRDQSQRQRPVAHFLPIAKPGGQAPAAAGAPGGH